MSRCPAPGSAVCGRMPAHLWDGSGIAGLETSMSSPWIASIALALVLAPREPPPFKQMADGKTWTIRNLDVDLAPSYCYDDAEANCRRHGRLYTWESAQRVCQTLGHGWKLPTDDEWRRLTTAYGG